MKRVLKIVVFLVAVLAILVVSSNLYLGRVVTATVNRVGPGVLGVPVELDHASVHLMRGNVELSGLRVGNPEGFRTGNAFELGSLRISLQPRSLLGDEIIIEHIYIDDPVITYERTLTGSNLDAILKGLEKAEDEEEKEVEADKEPGKKVIIEDFQLRGAKVNVSLPGMMGAAIPLPLPPITMTDIGKDKEGGASLLDVLNRVIRAILGSVVDVVAGSANLLGSGVQAVGEGAIRGVGAVGGAAAGAVGAVGEGAGRLVGGLLSRDREKDRDAEPESE
ncbi:MAG TPA: hypothetical protein PKE55_00195 [Kiritimatiellia bacterium]|nr:hypothetical protein [Kiritimatiellia bacterium]